MGSHDMLEVAHMAAHCLHMMGVDDQEKLFDAVTKNGARVMDLPDYGLVPGCNADLVLLEAGNIMEAIRLKPPRLAVIRRGRVVAESEPVHSTVHIHKKIQEVDFRLQRETR
jgi:cytosine deaminase